MCKKKLPVVVMVILSIYLKFLNVSKIDREGGKINSMRKNGEREEKNILFDILSTIAIILG